MEMQISLPEIWHLSPEIFMLMMQQPLLWDSLKLKHRLYRLLIRHGQRLFCMALIPPIEAQ
ncbi:putative secreted autotransporter toxin [Escherichia coli DEC6B]|nr:putative secreted autotransporter toxin [Escherichia coli DEC6B]